MLLGFFRLPIKILKILYCFRLRLSSDTYWSRKMRKQLIYLIVCFFHGTAEIHDRQQEEYEGLDKGYKDAHGHNRQGAKNAPASMNSIISTSSWPVILPKSLKERDKTLARWPMISMGMTIGISHHTGPRKCLTYLMPWYLTPIMWVNTNTGIAQASGGVDAGGGWVEAGHQSQQVAGGDVNKDGCDNRKEPAAFLAGEYLP